LKKSKKSRKSKKKAKKKRRTNSPGGQSEGLTQKEGKRKRKKGTTKQPKTREKIRIYVRVVKTGRVTAKYLRSLLRFAL